MKLLIFDTETTGLPRIRVPAMMEPNNWPHIVSISWVILNSDTNVIEKQKSYIIKPLNWTIPEDSVKIHGITTERANAEGKQLSSVIGEFLAEPHDLLVAHNLEFDLNVIYNAIRWDLELPFKHMNKPSCCTMELSRDICNLNPIFGKPKSPKLSELYEFVFKKQPNKNSLHNSLYDTLILAEVIQHCQELRSKMNLKHSQLYQQKNVNSKADPRILSLNLNE
jgi:DNA polymerase III epsilon subunit-like protein